MIPPTMAPGIEPKPPSTAAAKAFNPISEIEVSTRVMGASNTPATAATPAEIDQINAGYHLNQ